MTKVLVISNQCIASPNSINGKGGSLYCMVKAQNGFDVDLLYFGKKDIESEKDSNSIFGKIIHYDITKKYNKLNFALSFLKLESRLTCNYKFKKIKKLDIFNNYDYIVLDGCASLKIAKYLKKNKVIAFMIDSIPLNYERRSKFEPFFRKIYSRMQSSLLKKEERENYKFCRRIAFVSEIDSEYEKMINYKYAKNIKTVTNGIFADDIKVADTNNEMGLSLMFSGIMDYHPNSSAVEYFFNNLYEKILKMYPNLKVYLVGKNENNILKYSRENVIVTGKVDSIYKYMKGCTVYISPLTYGTGIKNKILEAMGCGCAIVASKCSVEGIDDLVNGENIFIADTCDEWIKYISLLLNSEILRKKFGSSCSSIISHKYEWESKLKELIYE